MRCSYCRTEGAVLRADGVVKCASCHGRHEAWEKYETTPREECRGEVKIFGDSNGGQLYVDGGLVARRVTASRVEDVFRVAGVALSPLERTGSIAGYIGGRAARTTDYLGLWRDVPERIRQAIRRVYSEQGERFYRSCAGREAWEVFIKEALQ